MSNEAGCKEVLRALSRDTLVMTGQLVHVCPHAQVGIEQEGALSPGRDDPGQPSEPTLHIVASVNGVAAQAPGMCQEYNLHVLTAKGKSSPLPNYTKTDF